MRSVGVVKVGKVIAVADKDIDIVGRSSIEGCEVWIKKDVWCSGCRMGLPERLRSFRQVVYRASNVDFYTKVYLSGVKRREHQFPLPCPLFTNLLLFLVVWLDSDSALVKIRYGLIR